MPLNLMSFFDLDENNAFRNSYTFKSISNFSQYYKAYYKENFIDVTFLVMNGDKKVGHVLCHIIDKKLTLPDGGVIIDIDENLSLKDKKKVYEEIIENLFDLSRKHDVEQIIIKDQFENNTLSSLGSILFNKRFESKLTFEMPIDFKHFDQKTYFSSLRRRYKSFINWGKRELAINYINTDNLDYEKFKQFQEFHYKISGRKTRSDESWLAQYDMLENGMGELSLATYKGDIVAGALFADWGNMSLYFTGVYERDLFEFGLSHFIIYDGILRSHARTQTDHFSLGYFDTDIKDSKWYNIQFFKKGFCNDLKPTIFWSHCVN